MQKKKKSLIIFHFEIAHTLIIPKIFFSVRSPSFQVLHSCCGVLLPMT